MQGDYKDVTLGFIGQGTVSFDGEIAGVFEGQPPVQSKRDAVEIETGDALDLSIIYPASISRKFSSDTRRCG
jgi:hypothetical protein